MSHCCCDLPMSVLFCQEVAQASRGAITCSYSILALQRDIWAVSAEDKDDRVRVCQDSFYFSPPNTVNISRVLILIAVGALCCTCTCS